MKTKRKIYHGNCVKVLKSFPENSIDSIVTDPPYGLKFMGKKWDCEVPSVEIWKECLRVLKPGGYLLCFAGTRTQHRMAVNIEDAGFDIRDMIAWVYGSGFPKSHNIGKAVDKLQGHEREVVGTRISAFGDADESETKDGRNLWAKPATKEVVLDKGNSEWEGWGTALKPALEPITVARKPLSEKTVALNVLKWGTGGINIDGSRVGTEKRTNPQAGFIRRGRTDEEVFSGVDKNKPKEAIETQGRFPANFIHDGSPEVLELFPQTKSGALKPYKENHVNVTSYSFQREKTFIQNVNSGSAARFFYCAKASKAERNRGCDGLEEKQTTGGGGMNNTEDDVCGKYGSIKAAGKNHHPTVKPVALIKYLVNLVTPKGGTVLDPFLGSGTTAVAAKELGFNCIGIEQNREYCEIAMCRIKHTEGKSAN